MQNIKNVFLLVVTLFALTSAHAQSPREQLNQMLQQLQKTPTDSALRERIINLASTLKPPPALPDAAVSFEGRAQFAFRSAKSEGDFLVAAQEYEKAVAAAPWVPGYYSDLCTIYEKAGKFDDAKRHCGFYLNSLTDPAQITDVKRRIAGLEFGIEKANSPQARAASQKQRDEELIRSLNGVRFDCPDFVGGQERKEYWLVINGNQLNGWIKMLQIDPDRARVEHVGQVLHTANMAIAGALARRGGPNWEDVYRISPNQIVREQKMDGRLEPSITCKRR